MELSQDKFPINFKYYDFIINLLHDQLSQETKDLNAFKNVFRINFYQNENFVQKVGEKLGILGGGKKEKAENRLTFRYQNVSEKEKYNVNHHASNQVV